MYSKCDVCDVVEPVVIVALENKSPAFNATPADVGVIELRLAKTDLLSSILSVPLKKSPLVIVSIPVALFKTK